MFFFERFLGIGTYMLVLVLVCFLLTRANMSCKSVFRFYLFCLCGMALFYKPYRTADLYRIFEQMRFFSSMDFDVFWNEYAWNSSVSVARLLYWFFGKIGIKELLPTFCAFLCYSLIFYVIEKTKLLYDVSNQTVAVELFFIMTTSMYISVIGGIRMMMALCLITFSFFRGTVEKKITIIDILLSALSLFIHLMGPICLVICALTLLLDSGKTIARRIGYLSIVAVIGVSFAMCFGDTMGNMMDEIYNGFVGYVFGDKYSDSWEYIMGALIILILLMFFKEFRYVSRKVDCKNVYNCKLASIICVIIALCFCFEFSIFYRFGAHLAVLFSIPPMMVTLDNSDSKLIVSKKQIDFRSVIILLSVLIATISCSRGSLSSLKFFEL